MDSVRFDTFARSLVGTMPRRGVGRWLTGLSLAGMLAPLAVPTPAEAKKRRKGKGKGKGKGKDKEKPCPAVRQCGPGCCPQGKVCGSNGACVDPTCCSGAAICGKHTSVDRLCCVFPRTAECCCDSTSGAQDGYVRCCDPGEDCIGSCPTGANYAQGGVTGTDPDPVSGICGQGGNGTQSCPG